MVSSIPLPSRFIRGSLEGSTIMHYECPYCGESYRDTNCPPCGENHNEEVLDEEDDPPECPMCAGTGEGQYDGSSCGYCNGRGVKKPRRDPDDFEMPEERDEEI